MEGSRPITVRKFFKPFALSVLAALAGTLLAHSFGAILKTSPPWLGPAIVFAVLTSLAGGVLLRPTLIRAIRATKLGPPA